VHCAFKECGFVKDDDRHIEQEEILTEHILQAHGDTMRACCGDDQDNYLAYYCCAIRIREREGVPTIGVSVDRRTFGHLVEAYNSNKVRSLICVCCAQIHTDTGAGEQSDIMMTQGPSQIFTRLAPKEDDSAEVKAEKMRRLELEFGLAKFKQRYGHGPLANVRDLEEKDDASEWQQRLELGQRRRRLSRKGPSALSMRILCCPEDIECDEHPRGSYICDACRVPVCRDCRRKLCMERRFQCVPMGLANDNYYGYIPDVISKHRVRWIEAAAACPVWTTLMIFYLEEDEGHLMREEMFHKQYRTGARGNAFSMHMPWEAIIDSLMKTQSGIDLSKHPAEQSLPWSEDILAQMVRVQLKVGSEDATRHISQVKLRPHVVLELLYTLIERQHKAFEGKSRRADFRDMKEALRKAVNAKYPPTHYVDPDGTVPPLVEKAMRHSLQEPSEASSIFDKSAIPGDAPTNCADVFEHMRPQAFFLERHSDNVEDPNARRAAA